MSKRMVNLWLMVLIFSLIFVWTNGFTKTKAYSEMFKIIAGKREYCFFYPQFEYTLNGYVLRGKDEICNMICDDGLVEPENAKIIFTAENDHPFVITKEKNGLKIDREKLKNKIENALYNGITTVKIEREIFEPTITKEDLSRQTIKRGSFSTYYGASSSERKHNISLAVSIINGSIVLPGQTFSFNDVVGKRSEKRGFKSANIIVGGTFKKGIGGGVCQVSSTLYNCALISGMEVIESHNHSLAVGYCKPSFDAMVSYGIFDLKFKNTSEYPIYIKGIANGNNIVFTFYGIKNPYEIKLVSKVKEVVPYKTTIIKSENLTDEVKERNGKDGLKSEGYIYIYKDEKLVEVKKIREDIYQPLNGIKIEN